MEKEILSDFHKLIIDKLGYLKAKYLHLEMGLPPHPVTKAYKTPEKTPHKILISFCEALDMHPYELIRDYQVGVLRISDVEKVYHQKVYHVLNKIWILSQRCLKNKKTKNFSQSLGVKN